MSIDPRAHWVLVNRSFASPRYALTNLVYKDETESDGTTNIYVDVENEDGSPASGITCWQGWPDGRAPKTTIGGSVDFVMSGDSSFAPDRGEHGPYYIFIESESRSDTVAGLGLPLKRHVNYYLTFRKTVGTIPPPGNGAGEVSRYLLDRLARAFKVTSEDLERLQ